MFTLSAVDAIENPCLLKKNVAIYFNKTEANLTSAENKHSNRTLNKGILTLLYPLPTCLLVCAHTA